MKNKKKFKFLEHTADVKFRAYGSSLKILFKNSVKAMFHTIYQGKVKAKYDKKISIKRDSLEDLMYDFLEEFLFLVETEGFLFSRFKKLKFDKKNLEINAIILGDFIEKYPVSFDIKAITYSEMFVKKMDGHWVSQVVLDV